MPTLRTLLGEGEAVVVGLPKDFKLSRALRSAHEIRLATAFAHQSGWLSIKKDIAGNSGQVSLLTGLECNQTEPAVLKDWLELQFHRPNAVSVKLAARKPFFHPKVLIVRSPTDQFAIVGSGNLSQGGFQTNCECGVFVQDTSTVAALSEWFDEQFDMAKPLTAKKIEAYEPEHKKAKQQMKVVADQQRETEEKLDEIGEASLTEWNRALKLAENFFREETFKAKYSQRQEAVTRMLSYLHPPEFDFNRKEWEQFYAERVLGRLNALSRDRVFRSGKRLKTALRELVKNPEATVAAVLRKNGKLRISGFGINTVSKLLAAQRQSEWFVYNSRVPEALADFGYAAPRGAGQDERYIAFCNLMKKFSDACKEHGFPDVDAISLDAFLLKHSGELRKRNANRRKA